MRSNDRYTSIFWGLLGLYLAYEGYRLKLGTLKNPQCGFLIFWAGMVLAGLSLILFFQAYFQRDRSGPKESLWKGVDWRKGTKMMVALLAYTLVFKWLGFIVSTFLLILFLFKGIEPQRWRTALILSVFTITVAYMVFGFFLELQFPAGILHRFFE